jgi:hypothetical protein
VPCPYIQITAIAAHLRAGVHGNTTTFFATEIAPTRIRER